MTSGNDHKVAADADQPVTVGSPNDVGGKILDFSSKGSGYYKVIVKAHEEKVTAAQDTFLQGSSVPEYTEEKRRLIYTLTSVACDSSGNIAGKNPLTFTRTDDLTTQQQSDFFTNNDLFQVDRTPNTISATSDTLGSDVSVTFDNTDGAGTIFPTGSLMQQVFAGGLLIDPDGSRYFINAVQVTTGPDRITFTLDKEIAVPAGSGLQPDPNLSTSGLKYTLIPADVVIADSASGLPIGYRNYAISNVYWNGTDFSSAPFGFSSSGGSKQTNIQDLRKIGTFEDLELIATKQLDQLTGGGNISWDLANNNLIWDRSFIVKVPTNSSLEYLIPASDTQTLFSSNFDENEVLYFVIPSNTSGSVSISLQKDSRGSGDLLNYDPSKIYVVAYRVNNQVFLNSNSLVVANTFTDQLKLRAANPNSQRVIVTGSDQNLLTGEFRSEQLSNLILVFDGAQIDYQTGNIYQSDGITALGINFTPVIPAAGMFRWMSATVIPGSVNSNNTINGQILVLPGSSDGASASAAPHAPFSNNGIPLGEVLLTSSDGINISIISQSDIVQLGVAGSPSGGAGIKADLYDNVSTVLPSGVSATIDGVSVVNGDKVLFSNLLSGNNRIYEVSGVGTSLVWSTQPEFSTPYDPTDGDEVIILKGTAFANQTAFFDGSTFEINNIVRHFNGFDYWQEDSIQTSTLFNNTTGNVFSVTALGSENTKVDFSIKRGTVRETGTLIITQDGLNASLESNSAFIGDTGVSFSASISGGNLVLSYITDNSGLDATMRYNLKRWSDNPGGVAGVPSYSSFDTYAGGYINSGFVMSQSLSPGFQINTPYNVSGKTRIDLLGWTYLVGLNSGSTVGDLEVLVNGQVIPRFLNGVTTDGYFKEISTSTIEFWTDLTTSNVSIELRKRQGTLDTGNQTAAKLSGLYEAIVGSTSEVSGGVATHTSINQAITDVVVGGKIHLLHDTFTENVVINKEVVIEGKGHGSVISGTLSFTAASFCLVKWLKVTGNITLDASSTRNYLAEIWQLSTSTLTDNGSGNSILKISE